MAPPHNPKKGLRPSDFNAADDSAFPALPAAVSAPTAPGSAPLEEARPKRSWAAVAGGRQKEPKKSKFQRTSTVHDTPNDLTGFAQQQSGSSSQEEATASSSTSHADAPPPLLPVRPAWLPAPSPAASSTSPYLAPPSHLLPARPAAASTPPPPPSPAQRERPRWKIPRATDIEASKFVWIEPLPEQQRALTTTTTTTTSDDDPNEGWRGHPGLILGRWDGNVHLLGTTSWGGDGIATKFQTAHDPALYHRWFFRLVGEHDALAPGEGENRVVRLRGAMAFFDQTRLDCRSVRRIPVDRFAAECSKYFRKRLPGRPREQVWIGEAESRKLTAQLFRLGGLPESPWKAADFALLREWRERMVQQGYRPDDCDEEEDNDRSSTPMMVPPLPAPTAGMSRQSSTSGRVSPEKFDGVLSQFQGPMRREK
ncbi:hypothetical protein GTA08_BOTSDO01020 [Botryosphaeria dothidea]|uniref:Uncharacterized protein n=1 Tax=Botryosphaeria dothidea TaxID=55169 RepID=A0A8H4J5F8_9PEZI|nr:hypothetical protein GTA08_BOTSDO01020 [Botryosphaeria dothidea]